MDEHEDESQPQTNTGRDIRENLARREEAKTRYYRGEISAEEMVAIERASPLYDVSLAERLAEEMSRRSGHGHQSKSDSENEA